MVAEDVCRDFLKGLCERQGDCRYRHPEKVVALCKDYLNNRCDRGNSCKYKHPLVCLDFMNDVCTYKNCKFFHPSDGPSKNLPPPYHGMKRTRDDRDRRDPRDDMRGPRDDYRDMSRGMRDGGRDPRDDPREMRGGGSARDFCPDFIRGHCRHLNCPLIHDIPFKRRRGDSPPRESSRQLPPPQDDRYGVTDELKDYARELEIKVKRYEERILDLERRCEKYEEYNKLLTQRNDELKRNMGFGPPPSSNNGNNSYQGNIGGAGYSSGPPEGLSRSINYY